MTAESPAASGVCPTCAGAVAFPREGADASRIVRAVCAGCGELGTWPEPEFAAIVHALVLGGLTAMTRIAHEQPAVDAA